MNAAIVLLSGPACSGKSELARRLAQRAGAVHLEMDAVRGRLLPGAAHTRADREVALRAMLWAAELLLERGIPVILDAQYRREEDRAAVHQLARLRGCPLYLIECAVSEEEAVRRFRARQPDPIRKDLTEEFVRQGARHFPYTRDGLLVDTGTQSLEECLRAIEAYLEIGVPNPEAAARAAPSPMRAGP